MKVLIADDSRAMRLIITRMLRRAGYDDAVCIEADCGRRALELALADPPDLVLSDWHMPDGDGMTLLAELRAAGSHAVFGLVTADATACTRDAAIAAGADFLLAKPFNPDTLYEAVSGGFDEAGAGAPCRPHRRPPTAVPSGDGGAGP